MMRKIWSAVLSISFLAIGLTGCAQNPSKVPENPKDVTVQENSKAEENDKGVIKIGVLAPKTGSLAEFGIGFEAASKMAVEKINAEGGANGYRLELVIHDSQSDPTVSTNLVRQMVDDESIMAIVGDYSSSSCMANAPIVDAAHLVQLSPSASSPDYAVMSPYCFSTVGRQDIEAPYFSSAIMKKYFGVTKIAIVRVNSDFGAATFKNFAAQAEKDGLEIVVDENFVDGETDFSSIITKMRAADPEAVLIIASGDVPKILNQMTQSGWTDIKIGVLGTGTSEQIIELCGENAEGIVTTTPFFFDKNNAELMSWLEEFKGLTGFVPSLHAPCMYDNIFLLKKSIEACGDEPVTREKIRDNLASVELQGLTGLIKFDENGTVPREYYIFGIENGEWVEKAGLGYLKE